MSAILCASGEPTEERNFKVQTKNINKYLYARKYKKKFITGRPNRE